MIEEVDHFQVTSNIELNMQREIFFLRRLTFVFSMWLRILRKLDHHSNFTVYSTCFLAYAA